MAACAAPSPTNSCRRSIAILAKDGVEHIVIETSGLALPKPLVQAFHWPAIKNRVTVDGVVVVVDGAALAEGRVAHDLDALAQQRAADAALDHDDPIEEVFEDQIACADLVVLNKRDLLDAAGLDKATAAIAGALPRDVKVVAVSGGKVDTALLLGLGVGTEDDIANRRTHHDDELDHDHDDFDSFVVPLGEIADPAKLAARVAALAEKFDVLRVKGFAAVAGKPLRLLVQAVGSRVTHQYDRPWAASEPRESRLVVIGLKGTRPRRGDARACWMDERCICSPRARPTSTKSSKRSISARRRATSPCCRSPTAISPGSPPPGRPSARACRACGSRICATCAIPCRSICGSTASARTPR